MVPKPKPEKNVNIAAANAATLMIKISIVFFIIIQNHQGGFVLRLRPCVEQFSRHFYVRIPSVYIKRNYFHFYTLASIANSHAVRMALRLY